APPAGHTVVADTKRRLATADHRNGVLTSRRPLSGVRRGGRAALGLVVVVGGQLRFEVVRPVAAALPQHALQFLLERLVVQRAVLVASTLHGQHLPAARGSHARDTYPVAVGSSSGRRCSTRTATSSRGV